MKPIPAWTGYFATSDGRILSAWRRMGLGKGRGTIAVLTDELRELRTFDRRDRRGQKTGYRSVCLAHRGRRRTEYVHALVMAAWCGERPEGFEVCHGNGKRDDNRLENLRYDTPLGNAADRVFHQAYGYESVFAGLI